MSGNRWKSDQLAGALVTGGTLQSRDHLTQHFDFNLQEHAQKIGGVP